MMYSYDLVLFGVMFTIIGYLIYHFIVLIRKDPDYWLFARNNAAYMKYWNFLERSQPKENTPLIKPVKHDEEKK